MGRGCGKGIFDGSYCSFQKELEAGWHIAISLGGTEMKRKPVSVCNETTCSQLWNPGMSNSCWKTLEIAPLPLCT